MEIVRSCIYRADWLLEHSWTGEPSSLPNCSQSYFYTNGLNYTNNDDSNIDKKNDSGNSNSNSDSDNNNDNNKDGKKDNEKNNFITPWLRFKNEMTEGTKGQTGHVKETQKRVSTENACVCSYLFFYLLFLIYFYFSN